MNIELSPMRWPAAWKDPALVGLLKGSGINYLLLEQAAGFAQVAARAKQDGIASGESASVPPGVTFMKGEWPGVRQSRAAAGNQASAGPTGVAWVDSNGWQIRLENERRPGTALWVEAAATGSPRAEAYITAFADAAAYGGRWIVSLDSELASGIAAASTQALEVWNKLARSTAFFAAKKAWAGYIPEAVMGVVSDFAGSNEFLSHEILNLVARTNQQYRILFKDKVSPESLSGLKAVLYADAQPPGSDLRNRILAYVQAGGMLITGPNWGEAAGAAAKTDEHPRYAHRVLGKGRIAAAKEEFSDPYMVANDSVVLISHRYELLRFWNPGALGSFFTTSPDRKRSLVQLLFYAAAREGEPSLRVLGRYKSAKLWTLDQPSSRDVKIAIQRDAVEVFLPAVSVYAGVELEA